MNEYKNQQQQQYTETHQFVDQQVLQMHCLGKSRSFAEQQLLLVPLWSTTTVVDNGNEKFNYGKSLNKEVHNKHFKIQYV